MEMIIVTANLFHALRGFVVVVGGSITVSWWMGAIAIVLPPRQELES